MPHRMCVPPWDRARARRSGERATIRMPSRISVITGSLSARGAGGGSFFRIVMSRRAETTKVTASIAIAIGALKISMRKPPIPKALNSATEPVAVRALLAATSFRRGTTVGR